MPKMKIFKSAPLVFCDSFRDGSVLCLCLRHKKGGKGAHQAKLRHFTPHAVLFPEKRKISTVSCPQLQNQGHKKTGLLLQGHRVSQTQNHGCSRYQVRFSRMSHFLFVFFSYKLFNPIEIFFVNLECGSLKISSNKVGPTKKVVFFHLFCGQSHLISFLELQLSVE